MPSDAPDISEEILLGRTLLEQGHLSTAQRVLVKVCQENPENAEAFRGLGDVLRRKGDEARARIIGEYAHDLNTPERPGPKTPPPAPRRGEPVVPPAAPASASSPLTMPSSSQPALPTATEANHAAPPADIRTPAKSGAWKYVVAGLMLLAGLVFLGYRMYMPSQRRGVSPREELDTALASGSFERLVRIRDKARAALAGSGADAEALLHLALADALLALDHGMPTAKSAEDTLRRLGPEDPANPEHLALAEAVRALLALAAGDRATAKQHVDAGFAKAAAKPLPALLLASARVRVLAGDTAGAGKDLDLALQLAPDFAPVVADWAAQRIDAGDATAARRAAREFLAKNKGAARVHLVAGEAERALGQSAWTKQVEAACRDESRVSREVRAACWLASAEHARLDGERATAVRKARAASQVSENPRVLADSALALALLGEIDAADEVLTHARKLASDTFAPLAWADLAIRLGRGQADLAAVATRPILPEHYLIALRAAYLRGGGAAMATTVKEVPSAIVDLDSDLHTYADLGREGDLSRGDRATLDRRGERGNPVAAFVAGVLSAREGDHKQAAKRLEKALAGHGDACRAALLYLSALQAQDANSPINRAALHALHARNAQCPIPEM